MIDAFTVNLVVAIVTMTAGGLYVLETLLRREAGPGRVWALAFLSAMLAVVAYLFWQGVAEPWVAIAIGNAALVSTSGFFWLGCCSFNGRALRWPAVVVAAVAIAQVVWTLLAGPEGGDWAGSEVLLFGIAVFAASASIESRRGNMGATLSAIGFTVVFALVALYYATRGIVFVVWGPESALFSTWFGSSVTGIVSIVLTIVALTTATMLRSGRITIRPDVDRAVLGMSSDGVLDPRSFPSALRNVLARARVGDELFAVVALRLDDLAQIGVAFGTDEEESVARLWRGGVRRYAPTFSLVGECDDSSMLVAFEPETAADAGRIASRIQRRVMDDFAERGSAVIPVVGVGVALSSEVGHVHGVLIAEAEAAAARSSTSPDASVIFAEGPDGPTVSG